MSLKTCLIFLLPFVSYAQIQDTSYLSVDIRVDRFSIEIENTLSELMKEIEIEKQEVEKLVQEYQPVCGDNKTDVDEYDISNDVWNLNQIASRCHERVDRLRKQMRGTGLSFRADDKARIESDLNEIKNAYDEIKGDVSKTEENGIDEEIEIIRQHQFYFTHMDENNLKYILTKSPWKPVLTRLSNSKLKLRISGCQNWITKCSIQDIAALEDETFVVTYTNSTYVRRFHSRGLLLSEFKFPWKLGGIATLNQSHIIVGVPEKKSLMILEVRDEGFVVKNHILMDANCGSDIDVTDNAVIMICTDPNTIRIYNHNWEPEFVLKDAPNTLLKQMHHLEENGYLDQNRTTLKSPKGAIWDEYRGVWYMVSTDTNKVELVRNNGLVKRNLFYVGKPTSIILLQRRRELVIGTKRGFIYIANSN
ncbi:uncharacterized protein LOC126810496 [Patella vulgata]|uniref:uncharacterized protein LOC126810496 n=1 Tax=Patella vulgata TaxID=6465 RepID=UPI002180080E|nr:uncharacterized protein LOC126810496 [Patella vulgata]